MTSSFVSRMVFLIVATLMVAGLSACGKKPGILKPPPGENGSSAPASYPASKDDL